MPAPPTKLRRVFDLDSLSGVLVALASPVTRDGAIDEAAAARLVDHVLAGGVQGVLALGSTGETASLDEPSRRRLLAAVVKARSEERRGGKESRERWGRS